MKTVVLFPGVFRRGNTHTLRIHVPKDIVQTYANGRRDFWIALGTSDPADANELAKIKKGEFALAFKAHRRDSQKAKGAVSTVGRPPVAIDIPRLSATLSQAHYVAVKDNDVVDRAELFDLVTANYGGFFKGEIRTLPDTEYWEQLIVGDPELPLTSVLSFCWWHWHGERITELKEAIKGGDFGPHVTRVETLLASENVTSTTKAQRLVLAKAIMQAEIDALTDIRKGDEERYQAIATATSVTAEPANKIPDEENPLLSVAAPKWMKEKIDAGKWRQRRADSCLRTIDLFTRIVGDKRIGDYAKADARDFKSVLCDLPANVSKLPQTRDLDIRAAAKKARALGLPTMSIVNVNKQLTIISGMFDWFTGQYEGVGVNPFAKATIEVSTSIRDERDPFTLPELKIMFDAPIFTGCDSEAHWRKRGNVVLRDSAKFWVPILGLYTGARLNELCKLKVADVRHASDLHFIDINTEGHRDVDIDSRVKSSASVRQVPLHAGLISFGFLASSRNAVPSGSSQSFGPTSMASSLTASGSISVASSSRSASSATRSTSIPSGIRGRTPA